MKSYSFFAMIFRMKYINRWSLMRNARHENLSEHSMETAVIAHALVIIHNHRFGGRLNAERAALLGLYHDAPESLTGDMPTPVKYHSEQIRKAYKSVEDNACRTLLTMLPQDLRAEYEPFFFPSPEDEPLWRFVKAADKLCALIKCIEEQKAGNTDFDKAAVAVRKSEVFELPEAQCFLAEFLPAYSKTLDDI